MLGIRLKNISEDVIFCVWVNIFIYLFFFLGGGGGGVGGGGGG